MSVFAAYVREYARACEYYHRDGIPTYDDLIELPKTDHGKANDRNPCGSDRELLRWR